MFLYSHDKSASCCFPRAFFELSLCKCNIGSTQSFCVVKNNREKNIKKVRFLTHAQIGCVEITYFCIGN